MGQSLPVPFTGVVTPTCRAAVKATKNKRIGVIATAATIDSGSYRKELNALHPEIQVLEQPCPLFVPLVENAFIDPGDQVTNLVAQRYLSDCAVPKRGYLDFRLHPLSYYQRHYFQGHGRSGHPD